MKRGLIVEKGKDHLKVMTRHMGVRKVALKSDAEVGQEIYFTHEDIVRTSGVRWNYIAAAAVFMLAVAAGGIGYAMQNMIYSVVSVDINPSVQMELNKKDKVVAIEALNDDALNIITEDMVGQQVEAVIAQLVVNAEEEGYFNEADGIEGNENLNAVMITTVETRADNDDIDAILSALAEDYEADGYKLILAEAEKEDLDEAEAEGVSVGIKMLEKWREQVAEQNEAQNGDENGEADDAVKTRQSVREFFYSLDIEDIDKFAEEAGAHFNQEMMKQAIASHKQAIADEKEARKADKDNASSDDPADDGDDATLEEDDQGQSNGKGKGLDKDNPNRGSEDDDEDDDDEDDDDETDDEADED